MKSIRGNRRVTMGKKYFCFFLILFFHLSFLSSVNDTWALNVRLGKNVTITRMNLHEAWKEVPAPQNPSPTPPKAIEYWSIGNTAYTFVWTSATKEDCEDGQSGNAFATLGVEFYVEGKVGQSAHAEITINFSTNAESMVNGGNTADACLWRIGKGGCIHRALCSIAPGPGPISCLQRFGEGDESITFSENLIAGQTFQTGLHIYSHSDTCYAPGVSYALNTVTINSIKIKFTECDFSITPEIEIQRCFGGIGSQCEGFPLGFRKNERTCFVDGWMSVGSILHDKCCLETQNAGYFCSGWFQGDPTLCGQVFFEAIQDTLCSRVWPHRFGPYPVGNTGDVTSQDLKAPAGALVRADQQGFCLSGKCRVIMPGEDESCGIYCECQ